MSGTNRRTSLVVAHGGGRFGNRLVLFSHLIALAAEHDWVRIVNVGFWPFADHCAGTQRNPLCVFPLPPDRRFGIVDRTAALWQKIARTSPRSVERAMNHFLPRLLYYTGRHRLDYIEEESQDIAIGQAPFLDQLRGKRRVLLAAWYVRDWQLLRKHADTVRRFLRPAERFERPACKFIDGLRQRHGKLVGVLMRQGDYDRWRGGIFYYTSLQYRRFLEQLRDRFGPDCAFVVACDEVQDPQLFSGLNAYWSTGAMGAAGHYMESFVELSMCDVVVSVPSTFSLCAAFIGDRPVLPIGGRASDLSQTPLVEDHLFGSVGHPALRVSIRC